MPRTTTTTDDDNHDNDHGNDHDGDNDHDNDGNRGANMTVSRTKAAGAASLTVATGLGIRAVTDGDIAKYAGDVLYTVLVCALVLVAAPRTRPLAVAGTGLALSWAVELLQLTGLPADLSRHSTVARLVLGSTFNAPDLLWYAVGAGIAWAATAPAARNGARPERGPIPANDVPPASGPAPGRPRC